MSLLQAKCSWYVEEEGKEMRRQLSFFNLGLGPGARWLNRFCDGCRQRANASASDGRGRAAERGLRFSCGEASALSPAPPSRQDGHIRGSLPLISHCYVGQETHLHFALALLASLRVLWKHEEQWGGGVGGGGSVRDSTKLGPNLGHPAPLISQRTLSLYFLLFQFWVLWSLWGKHKNVPEDAEWNYH